MDLDAAQDAYQAWLRARSLALDAARAFLAKGDPGAKQELEAMLMAETKTRAEFEARVQKLQ